MTSGSRWSPVAAYAAVAAANQMLWLTFTPLTSAAERYYGTSAGAIGWLAEIFPLAYVLLAIPTGRLVERDLGRYLALGAVLTAAGALVRLGGHAYVAVLAGQLLIAIAQPLVLNAITKLASGYLTPSDRPTGIAVSSAGIFAGMVLALLLGAVLGGDRIAVLLAIQAALAVAAAAWLCVALRAPRALSTAAAAPVRAVWVDRRLRYLISLVCAGFGVFIAVTTWLQKLLEPAGVSEDAAGYLLLAMVLAGVVGSALLPAPIARRGGEITFVLGSVIAAAAGCIALAVAPGVAVGLVAVLVIGVALLTDLPVILELAERWAGAAGATATSLVWLAGNAAGLVAALVVQAVLGHPAIAFVLLAACLVAGLPLLVGLRRAVAERLEDGSPALQP